MLIDAGMEPGERFGVRRTTFAEFAARNAAVFRGSPAHDHTRRACRWPTEPRATRTLALQQQRQSTCTAVTSATMT
jgi:hypothetical protein